MPIPLLSFDNNKLFLFNGKMENRNKQYIIILILCNMLAASTLQQFELYNTMTTSNLTILMCYFILHWIIFVSPFCQFYLTLFLNSIPHSCIPYLLLPVYIWNPWCIPPCSDKTFFVVDILTFMLNIWTTSVCHSSCQ